MQSDMCMISCGSIHVFNRVTCVERNNISTDAIDYTYLSTHYISSIEAKIDGQFLPTSNQNLRGLNATHAPQKRLGSFEMTSTFEDRYR